MGWHKGVLSNSFQKLWYRTDGLYYKDMVVAFHFIFDQFIGPYSLLNNNFTMEACSAIRQRQRPGIQKGPIDSKLRICLVGPRCSDTECHLRHLCFLQRPSAKKSNKTTRGKFCFFAYQLLANSGSILSLAMINESNGQEYQNLKLASIHCGPADQLTSVACWPITRRKMGRDSDW